MQLRKKRLTKEEGRSILNDVEENKKEEVENGKGLHG